MKLYLITRKGKIDYDEYDAMVVRATNEEQARRFAADQVCTVDIRYSYQEGRDEFLSAEKSDCVPLTYHGEAGVVLGSFNAG